MAIMCKSQYFSRSLRRHRLHSTSLDFVVILSIYRSSRALLHGFRRRAKVARRPIDLPSLPAAAAAAITSFIRRELLAVIS